MIQCYSDLHLTASVCVFFMKSKLTHCKQKKKIQSAVKSNKDFIRLLTRAV